MNAIAKKTIFNPEKVRSILIIQICPFGDVLLNTSCLHALKHKFPQANIDFLVSQPYDSVLSNHPALSRIVSFKKKTGLAYVWERVKVMFRVFLHRYDLVIDQQAGTGSAQIVFFSAARYRLGYDNNRFTPLFNLHASRGPERYSASKKFDLLKALGIEEEPYELYYHIKPESMSYIGKWLEEHNIEKHQYICFSPGSPLEEKKWLVERYAALADQLAVQTSLKIVILWAFNEKQDADRMLSLMKQKACLAPPTDLNQGAAMLKYSRLLICNDGGINHISVATQTPSLAIFGPTKTIMWCPGQVFPNHRCLSHPEHYVYGDNSFAVSVDEALEAALSMLGESEVE